MRSLVAVVAVVAAAAAAAPGCVSDLGGTEVAGVDAGEAPGAPDAAAPVVADAGPRPELRGVWITRFAYSNQASLEAIIDRAADAHMNAVFVQIRGQGDAFYQSTKEPWSARLSGVLGRDPGWDPLEVAIDRGHARGLEVHAYFNVFSAWTAAAPPPAAEGPVQHALYTHPEWLAVTSSGQNLDGEYRWFSPGNPAVRAHIAATARELLERYDVDGLHLDRIRTAGYDYSHDPVTEAAFAAAQDADPSLDWGAFMRAQVGAMVAELHDVVVEVRPSARLSASVWGIYEVLPGCNTSEGRLDYHQDSLAWLEAGDIDALVPMIYWSIAEGSCTDWAALVDGFVARGGADRIWAGMHALDQQAWMWPELAARIAYGREVGLAGLVVFASTYLDQDQSRWAAFPGTDEAPGPYFAPAEPR